MDLTGLITLAASDERDAAAGLQATPLSAAFVRVRRRASALPSAGTTHKSDC